jgi:phenylpyruvate tautomerase PptA (4-oxalocrotonate tautomerase family)
MPFYQCQTPEGLLDEDKRAKLADEITRIHCETTGAPKMFVHVAFTEPSAAPATAAESSRRSRS